MCDGVIAIIGLGYVGLPLAVEFGKKYRTVGYDINSKRVKQLIDGFDVTREVSSDEIHNANQLVFTDNPKYLNEADYLIVTVPTPIDSANRPDLTPLSSACEIVGQNMKKGATVIFESTVFPGCTRDFCIPRIQKISGFQANIDFFYGYSPERIVPGDKVNTLTTIQKITSGSTSEASSNVSKLYGSIITAGIHQAESVEVAEAAKVIENAQRDLNIAFVNELSIIFGKLGIDTAAVLAAAGTKWNFLDFKPGLVGGHCIGVDPYYLTHKAEELGYHPQVILAGRRINDYMPEYVANGIVKALVESKCDFSNTSVAVFGATFKENCPDVRNSKSIEIIQYLISFGIDVQLVDPVADHDELLELYGLKVKNINDVSNVSAIIVSVAHDEFKKLTIQKISEFYAPDKKKIIYDVKSILDKDQLNQNEFNSYRL